MTTSNIAILFGADDPEAQASERLCHAAGWRVWHAVGEDRKRVHPGNAYAAVGAIDPDTGEFNTFPPGDRIYLFECGFVPEHPYRPGKVQVYTDPQAGEVYFPSSGAEEFSHEFEVVRIDHHRPGDPGYGVPPERFLEGSSIGQVLAVLACQHDAMWWFDRGCCLAPAPSHAKCGDWVFDGSFWLLVVCGDSGPATEAVSLAGTEFQAAIFIAAADHCLEAAYRDRCPGVNPDALMRWRAESRARFQKRPVDAVLADIEAARVAMKENLGLDANRHYADLRGGLYSVAASRRTDNDEDFHGSLLVHRTGYLVGKPATDQPLWLGSREAADERIAELGRDGWTAHAVPVNPIPELPEAACRERIPFLSTVRDRDGREKVVLQAAPADLVRRFLAGELVPGLCDYYGSPERGLAGGYTAPKE